jgi:hypothetical protein
MDETEYSLDSDYFKTVAKHTTLILAVASAGAVAIVASTEKIKKLKKNRAAKKNAAKN